MARPREPKIFRCPESESIAEAVNLLLVLGRAKVSAWLALLLAATIAGAAEAAVTGVPTEEPVRLHCASFTKAPPPAPTPQTEPHAIERFQAINREVRSGPDTVLFLGDSLTEDWDAAIWQQHFARRDALNAGIRGDRSEHLLWRLRHGNLDGPSPKAVVLLIGTNDVGKNRPPEIIAEGIRANLFEVRSRFPQARILLLGLLPRSQSPTSERRWQISQVNRQIRQCDDGQHIFYAGLGSALLDSGGRLSPEISPDGVHLSPRGYAILAARLDTELDHLLSSNQR
jgi:beta-glucosidase